MTNKIDNFTSYDRGFPRVLQVFSSAHTATCLARAVLPVSPSLVPYGSLPSVIRVPERATRILSPSCHPASREGEKLLLIILQFHRIFIEYLSPILIAIERMPYRERREPI